MEMVRRGRVPLEAMEKVLRLGYSHIGLIYFTGLDGWMGGVHDLSWGGWFDIC